MTVIEKIIIITFIKFLGKKKKKNLPILLKSRGKR